jgi:hypothetical protein
VYDTFSKDPNAVLDYLFDWGPFLEGDTIQSSSLPAFPAGLTLVTQSTSDEEVTIWLSGGTGGSDYTITNRIETTGGRTMDWILVVSIYEKTTIPKGPPFAHIIEHTSYTAQAEGEEAFKIEMVAADAADIVQTLVPQPLAVSSVLSAAMDEAQDTIPVVAPYPTSFPDAGEVLIDNELISYGRKIGTTVLADALRGRSTTTPATHASGDAVKEVGYALRARRAELAIFEWLFLTRGWRPSRSGILGSENYLVGDEAKQIVRTIMGPYYGRKGGGVRRSIPMTSFPRRGNLSPADWQMGWFDV